MSKRLHIDNVKEINLVAPQQLAMYQAGSPSRKEDPYFRQKKLRLSGRWSQDAVQVALDKLWQRHDSLRSIFKEKGGKLLMIVLKIWQAPLTWIDLENTEDQEKLILDFQEEDREQGFDFQKKSLVRVAIFRHGDEDFTLILSYHHMIMDGWGADQLSREFVQLYQGEKLPQAAQYGSYLRWLHAQSLVESQEFWKAYLKDYRGELSLKGGGGSSDEESAYRRLEWEWTELESKALRLLADQNQSTVSTCFQVLWALLLAWYSGKRDVLFGVVISGRPSAVQGVDEIVGLFINIIPVRIRFEEKMTFGQLLNEVQRQIYQREAHEYLPLSEIQQTSPLGRLFDHLLVFEHYDQASDNQDPWGKLDQEEQISQTEYDLLLAIDPRSPMKAYIDYRPSVHDRDFVARAAEHLLHLSRQVAATPDINLDQLEYLTPDEKVALAKFQPSQSPYTSEYGIIPLFKAACNRNPKAIAITGQGKSWSYEEVGRYSDLLAFHLEEKIGIEPGDVVAYFGAASPWTPVLLLAIWKLRAIYLPLRKDWPEARLKEICEDSSAKALVRLSDSPGFMDDILPGLICEEIEEKKFVGKWTMPAGGKKEDPAYLIYTSGTSGKPKGVIIRQESITDRILYHLDILAIDHQDTLLQYSSLSFDASLVEMLMALLGGGRLHVPTLEEKQNFTSLSAIIEDQAITAAIFPPAVLQGLQRRQLPTLRLIISTGEAAHVEESLHYARSKAVWNGYGPTETCIGATFHRVDPSRENLYKKKGQIPIGRPFANTRVYILNEAGQLLPLGRVGEIWIAGIGLSTGYLNLPEETSLRFIKNPPHLPHEKRIYRSGDLGRWTSEGELEYLGRADKQVQIRGIRIEPQEIESIINSYTGVTKAYVRAVELEGQTSLWAYFKGLDTKGILALKTFLYRHLPPYMCPAQLIPIKDFPLTAHGKIDEKALPNPNVRKSEGKGMGLKKGMESKLATLWSDILGQQILNADDDFFEKGGHSLKAMQLATAIFDRWGIAMTANEVFAVSSLWEQALHLESLSKKGNSSIPMLGLKEDYPTSPAQQGLWLAYQQKNGKAAYHVPLIFDMKGSLHPQAWENAWKALLKRHESLRTHLFLKQGELRQRIRPMEVLDSPCRFKDFSSRDEGTEGVEIWISSEVCRPFHFDRDALIRIALLKIGPDQYKSLVLLHHIICDPASMEILARDFYALYEAELEKVKPNLPELRIHYKDYVGWVLEREEDSSDRKYWHDRLKGIGEGSQLPMDRPRRDTKTHEGEVITLTMDREFFEELKELCKREQLSLLMLFTCAVSLLIHRLTLSRDIVVGTTLSGREHSDLKNLIGFFVKTLVLRHKINTEMTLREILLQVREDMLRDFSHQDYPFSNLVNELIPKRDRSRGAFFDVLIEYLPMGLEAGEEISLSGLVIKPLPLGQYYSKHDIAFRFLDYGQELECYYKYNPNLFDAGSIQKFHQYLLQILTFIKDHPGLSVGEFPLKDSDPAHAREASVSGFDFQF